MGTRARPSSTSVSSSSSPEAVSGSRSARTRWARRPAAIVRAARLPRASPTRHCAEPGSPPRRAAPTGPTSTSRPSACRSPRSSASPCKPSSPADIRARVAEFPGGIRLLGGRRQPVRFVVRAASTTALGSVRTRPGDGAGRGVVERLGRPAKTEWDQRTGRVDTEDPAHDQDGTVAGARRVGITRRGRGRGARGKAERSRRNGEDARRRKRFMGPPSDVCDDLRPIAKRRRRKLARR